MAGDFYFQSFFVHFAREKNKTNFKMCTFTRRLDYFKSKAHKVGTIDVIDFPTLVPQESEFVSDDYGPTLSCIKYLVHQGHICRVPVGLIPEHRVLMRRGFKNGLKRLVHVHSDGKFYYFFVDTGRELSEAMDLKVPRDACNCRFAHDADDVFAMKPIEM